MAFGRVSFVRQDLLVARGLLERGDVWSGLRSIAALLTMVEIDRRDRRATGDARQGQSVQPSIGQKLCLYHVSAVCLCMLVPVAVG